MFTRILPELPAPLKVQECNKCELALQRARVIWGEGNPSGSVAVILDNPGAREDKFGEPFLCGTRQALQEAIFKSGIKQEEVFVTWLLKCRPVRKYNKEKAQTICLDYLKEQLFIYKPKFLVCMGNLVVQVLLNPEAEVKNLRGKWLDILGYPAVVSYHPLAARRRPNLMKYLVEDFLLVQERMR